MTWTSERLARAALTVAAEPGVMAGNSLAMQCRGARKSLTTDIAG